MYASYIGLQRPTYYRPKQAYSQLQRTRSTVRLKQATRRLRPPLDSRFAYMYVYRPTNTMDKGIVNNHDHHEREPGGSGGIEWWQFSLVVARQPYQNGSALTQIFGQGERGVGWRSQLDYMFQNNIYRLTSTRIVRSCKLAIETTYIQVNSPSLD